MPATRNKNGLVMRTNKGSATYIIITAVAIATIELSASWVSATEYPGGIPGHWNISGQEAVRRFFTRFAVAGVPLLVGSLLARRMLVRASRYRRPDKVLTAIIAYLLLSALWSNLLPSVPDKSDPRSLGVTYGWAFGTGLGLVLLVMPAVVGLGRCLGSKMFPRRGFEIVPHSGPSSVVSPADRRLDH